MRLQISNFQSIREADLEIKGFTVFKGHTSSGKSSVRRALSSLFHNNWDKSFIRRGSKQTDIILDVDGHTVAQAKSSTRNDYLIRYPDGKTVKLEKVGITVPEELKDLGIRELVADDLQFDTILSSQLDPLFMVSFRDVVKTKLFNRIFNTQRYEVASRLVQKDIYNKKVELGRLDDDIDEVKKKIIAAGQIRDSLGEIQGLCRMIESLEEFRAGERAVSDAMDEAGLAKKRVRAVESILAMQEKVQACLDYSVQWGQYVDLSSVLGTLDRKVGALGGLVALCSESAALDGFLRYAGDVAALKSEMDQIDKSVGLALECTNLIADMLQMFHFCSLKTEVEQLSDVSSKMSELKSSISDLLWVNAFLSSVDEVRIADLELLDVESEIGETWAMIPEVCPTCGSVIRHGQK